MKAHFSVFLHKWISGYEVSVVRNSLVHYNKFSRPKWLKTYGSNRIYIFKNALLKNFHTIFQEINDIRSNVSETSNILFRLRLRMHCTYFHCLLFGEGRRLRKRKTFCDGNGNIYKRFPLGKEELVSSTISLLKKFHLRDNFRICINFEIRRPLRKWKFWTVHRWTPKTNASISYEFFLGIVEQVEAFFPFENYHLHSFFRFPTQRVRLRWRGAYQCNSLK